jgi:hypothetical protein
MPIVSNPLNRLPVSALQKTTVDRTPKFTRSAWHEIILDETHSSKAARALHRAALETNCQGLFRFRPSQ